MTTELEQEFYKIFEIENPDEMILVAFISALENDIKTVQDYKKYKNIVLKRIIENKELFPYAKQAYEQVRNKMKIILKNDFKKLSDFYNKERK